MIFADLADHGEFGPIDIAAEAEVPRKINTFGGLEPVGLPGQKTVRV